MKNLLLIVFLIFFPLLNKANSEEKISIINMEYLMENSIAGKSIKSKLESINKKNNAYFKKKETELKEQETKIIKQRNVLSIEEFEKNLSLFRKEVNSYKQEKLNKNNQLNQLKIKSINELLKQLSPLIAEFSKNNNISMVLDKKNTIVSKVESDITQKILKILDSKIKKINIK